MPRPKAIIPLVEKIAQAFEAVGKLPRAGKNKSRGYPYTRATDVFEAVRLELFRRKILICPTEGVPEYVKIADTNGGEQITECRLQVTYTVRDALEKLEPMIVNGIGRDVEDKALYKAQTGAQKALLRRLGLIAEETDDPEWDGQETQAGETIDDAAPMRTPRKEQPLATYQIEAIGEAMASTGKTADELSQVVAARFHAAAVENVKRRDFKELLKWASDGRGTITPPKAQAAPDQGALPLRAAEPMAPIEMRIGQQTVKFQPKDKPYAI